MIASESSYKVFNELLDYLLFSMCIGHHAEYELKNPFTDCKEEKLMLAMDFYKELGKEAEGYEDPLGELFMNYITRGQNGQFFTPMPICKVMAGMTMNVFGFLGQLVTFKAHAADVAGPIGIMRISAQAAKIGWATFLSMMALISLELAIFNLLPIPMLDGGHMAVLAYERFRGRDLTMEFKERLFTGGFLLIASLMAVVIFMDGWKLRK